MRKVFGFLFRFLLCLAVIVSVLLAFMTVTEYRPQEREALSLSGISSRMAEKGQEMTILSWNTGYGALGDNADFFMDGGTGVITSDEDRIRSNIDGMIAQIRAEDPDLILLQEVDLASKRSFHINETRLFAEAFAPFVNVFAYNYRALYVPYPLPPLGRVESGIQTFSRFRISESERIALPCPFTWPVSTVNLKRGLLVSRIPVSGTDSELVLINLHLEAYDSGEGKAEQSRVLSEFLKAEYDKGNYVIAGGDFNQVFSNIDTSAYPMQSGLWLPGLLDASVFDPVFSLMMDASSPTCRSLDRPYAGADREGFQYYLIDGYIVSDNVTVTGLETRDLDFVCSDHNPVILKAVLN